MGKLKIYLHLLKSQDSAPRFKNLYNQDLLYLLYIYFISLQSGNSDSQVKMPGVVEITNIDKSNADKTEEKVKKNEKEIEIDHVCRGESRQSQSSCRNRKQ